MTIYDWVRLVYLILSGLAICATVTQHRWFFNQPRKVRMLLASLVLYAAATVVAGIELLLFDHLQGGGARTVLVAVASATMLAGLLIPKRYNT